MTASRHNSRPMVTEVDPWDWDAPKPEPEVTITKIVQWAAAVRASWNRRNVKRRDASAPIRHFSSQRPKQPAQPAARPVNAIAEPISAPAEPISAPAGPAASMEAAISRAERFAHMRDQLSSILNEDD